MFLLFINFVAFAHLAGRKVHVDWGLEGDP